MMSPCDTRKGDQGPTFLFVTLQELSGIDGVYHWLGSEWKLRVDSMRCKWSRCVGVGECEGGGSRGLIGGCRARVNVKKGAQDQATWCTTLLEMSGIDEVHHWLGSEGTLHVDRIRGSAQWGCRGG